MTDRRAVDALSIEEIERILVMKRRAVRRERLQRLAQIGRVINDPPVYLDSSSAAATSDHPARNEEGVLPSYNPFPSVEYESAGVLQAEGAAGKLPEKSRFARIRDRALLALEVLALVGLVTILGGSLANLKTLNEEVAQAREIPTPTVTPLIRVSVLPGGSSPPSAMNDVPVAYRNLVKLASAAYLEGFYYRPRIDLELLTKHKAGLIVLSGCTAGELCHHLRMDLEEAALATLEEGDV